MDESRASGQASGLTERNSLLKAALVLQRVGSHARAVETLSKLLTLEPYNVTALRAVALSWQQLGESDLACSALERARATEPENIAICIELAEVFTASADHENAHRLIRCALDIDPNSAPAHKAMVATLQSLGRSGEALQHRQRSISVVTNLGGIASLDEPDEPLRVLLIASGDTAHSTVTRALRRHDIAMIVMHVESMSVNTRLPDHDILFGALTFDARFRATLQQLEEQLVRSKRPILNRPASILATDPAILAWRLAPIEGLRIAGMTRIDRVTIDNARCAADLAARNMPFPMLIRGVSGQQTRRERVASFDELKAYVTGSRATQFEVSPFFDLSSSDGRSRCYRVALVGNNVLPLAFASSFHWRVDLSTNDESSPTVQIEEEEFFTDCRDALGHRTMHTLQNIAKCIEIDTCVVDLSFNDADELTILRIDASSDWPDPPEGEAFALRRRASDRARQAIFTLILDQVEKKNALIS